MNKTPHTTATQPETAEQAENSVLNSEQTAPANPSEANPASENTANPTAELQDQFVRLQADFQNFRKRVDSERQDLLRYGASKTLEALLPVLDNLSRGTATLNENSDPKLLYQSFQLVIKELNDTLTSQGLKPIDAVGQPFDPFFHEAISNMPSADYPENQVMQVVQSGYTLHDRVLRPAMVIVSAGSPDSASGGENPFVATQAES